MNIRFNDREKKIINCIEEITGITPSIAKQQDDVKEQYIEPYHVKKILLLSIFSLLIILNFFSAFQMLNANYLYKILFKTQPL